MISEKDIDKIFNRKIYEKIVPSDFAIVLGCPPEGAIKRAEMGAHFYHAGGAKKLIVSGGVCHDYEGEKVPEYRIMHDTLLKNGVPEEAIIDETRARDTVQNMIGAYMDIFQNTETFSPVTVTIVTSMAHMPRSLATAKLYAPGYMTLYGYTEDVEGQLATDDAGIKRELTLINWFLESNHLEEI